MADKYEGRHRADGGEGFSLKGRTVSRDPGGDVERKADAADYNQAAADQRAADYESRHQR